MPTQLLQALFSETKRQQILEWTKTAKPISCLGGVSGIFIAGLGLLIIRKSGLLIGIGGYIATFLGCSVALGSYDAWRAIDNAETLVLSGLVELTQALSTQNLTNKLTNQCIILPLFKQQIKQAIDKAEEEERKAY